MKAEVKSASSERTEKGKARELILEAAEKVFGEAGIKGATTKEIARAAGVNETTLFRNFPSKMALLLALVEKHDAEASNMTVSFDWSYDLAQDLQLYATSYLQFLSGHKPLILAFVAEATRMPEEARQVVKATSKPCTAKLIEYFEEARQRNLVREDVESLQTAHAFEGIIFSFMIHSTLKDLPYDSEAYFDTVIHIFARGLQPQA